MNNRLKVLRAERNWSQAELALRLDVSRQAVNAIETGKHDPSLQLVFRIAAFSTCQSRRFSMMATNEERHEERPARLGPLRCRFYWESWRRALLLMICSLGAPCGPGSPRRARDQSVSGWRDLGAC